MSWLYRMILIVAFLHLPVWGASIEDAREIARDVEINCILNSTKCKVNIVESERFIASTSYDNIYISTYTIDFLSKEELRSVAYHELAHTILKHSLQIQYYRERIYHTLERELSYDEEKRIRHKVEEEADTFSCFLLWLNGRPNYLDNALIKVNKKYKADPNKEGLTHPSLNKRLNNIQRLKRLYGN